jgi:hypothetical protein
MDLASNCDTSIKQQHIKQSEGALCSPVLRAACTMALCTVRPLLLSCCAYNSALPQNAVPNLKCSCAQYKLCTIFNAFDSSAIAAVAGYQGKSVSLSLTVQQSSLAEEDAPLMSYIAAGLNFRCPRAGALADGMLPDVK